MATSTKGQNCRKTLNSSYQASAPRNEDHACALRTFIDRFKLSRHGNASPRTFPRLPALSQDRLDVSVTEQQIDFSKATPSDLAAATEKGKTVLYLAYGSNLCNETFRGKRGIQPLSQINVQVPELRLTFDLPGFPYTEPCFANTALRDPETDKQHGTDNCSGGVESEEYHKDRWHKGLVGCVYEVTPEDYAHIIATEGGGSSYDDILVTCYPLPDAETVPTSPVTKPFKAHTLFAPVQKDKRHKPSSGVIVTGGRFSRPDPSYAQPSARYLALITTGAAELSMPSEYQAFLQQIRPYTITTRRQAMAQKIMVSTFLPIFMMFMELCQKFQDKKGRTPKWLSAIMGWVFATVWRSYDVVWKGMFGDGERTEGQGEDGVGDIRSRWMGSRREERVIQIV
ncbi:hypothetical protein CC78DRAFT_537285 [Lojkania enalia]|uniref:gamma-glutamylcyclotransferase n=1 Tax=Lojkania enalia TaxID=147567 RepID=A0A9P4K493_9PLEO|nr:hypothetical protein CC78DRAFT_537285 [Didymosphaeria enalia]